MANTITDGDHTALSRHAGSVSPERFVSDYADEHLYEADNPRGMCANCEHYRRDNGWSEEGEDWCWIKEGKYADGRWHECPAWIASQNAEGMATQPAREKPESITD